MVPPAVPELARNLKYKVPTTHPLLSQLLCTSIDSKSSSNQLEFKLLSTLGTTYIHVGCRYLSIHASRGIVLSSKMLVASKTLFYPTSLGAGKAFTKISVWARLTRSASCMSSELRLFLCSYM